MMRTRSWLLRSAGILALLTIAFPAATGTAGVSFAKSSDQTTQPVTKLGTTTVSGIGAGTASVGTTDQYTTGPAVDQLVPKSGLGGNTRLPADHVPRVAANSITTANPGFFGFNGITHRDQRLAGTGSYTNTQFSLEPPDQGLCTDGTDVVEVVNNGLRVFTTAGSLLTATIALSQFFKRSPEVIRSTPRVFGDFISDPKCLYDSGHFFLTEVELDTNPSSGNFTGTTRELIAVSQTGDPTGTWNLYSFYATDDGFNGTPAHPNCPCLGDQPLIGADANGFYISTNEFPLFVNGFNGPQLYAISKSALESGASPLAVNQINVGGLPTPDPGGIWYSLQPATTPPGGSYASGNGGTEYFLSALQFFVKPSLDNRIAVWALTNTSSLNSVTPSLELTDSIVQSEVYGQPNFGAQQAPGPTPLGSTVIPLLGGKPAPEELLAGNDDRMNQVVYAGGDLWSGVNTILSPPSGPTRVGIAYFIVSPSVDGSGQVSGTMANQGYVAANQQNVLFPSIGVNADGQGVMSFTLAGPDYFPSAAYAPIDATNGAGSIHIAGPGAGPEDGFTGYASFGGSGRIARWGDYSAAVAAPDGSIWLATEYIPNAPRTALANWGTFVSQVTP